jgi:hypothetical protein
MRPFTLQLVALDWPGLAPDTSAVTLREPDVSMRAAGGETLTRICACSVPESATTERATNAIKQKARTRFCIASFGERLIIALFQTAREFNSSLDRRDLAPNSNACRLSHSNRDAVMSVRLPISFLSLPPCTIYFTFCAVVGSRLSADFQRLEWSP